MLVVLQLKLPGSKWDPSRYQESLPLVPTPPLCPSGQFLLGALMHFKYLALLEGRKVLTGEDDRGTRQNKWLIQGHAGNLTLRQEQSVSSLSSSQALCPCTQPRACLPKPNKQRQTHTNTHMCVHTCAHVARRYPCKLKCSEAAGEACSCTCSFHSRAFVHFEAQCLTKVSGLKLHPIECMESAILERIFICQYFGGAWFIPEMKHNRSESSFPQVRGHKGFQRSCH